MDAVANLDVMLLNEEDFLDFENMIAEDLSAYENPRLFDEWTQNQKSIVEPFFVTSEHADWHECDPRLYSRRFWFKMDDILDDGQESGTKDSVKRDTSGPFIPQPQQLPGASSRGTPSFHSEEFGEILNISPTDIGKTFSSETVKAYLQRGLYPYIDTAGNFKISRVINPQRIPNFFQQASLMEESNPFAKPVVGVLQTRPSAVYRKEARSTAGIQLWKTVLSDNEPSTSSKNTPYNLSVPQTAVRLIYTPDFTLRVPHHEKMYKTKSSVKAMLYKNVKAEAQSKGGTRLPLSFKNNRPTIDIEDSDSDSEIEVVDVVTPPESYPDSRWYSMKSSKQELCKKSSKMKKEILLKKNSTKLRI